MRVSRPRPSHACKRLVPKRGLGHDPETQLVEDAIRLTFLETQFEELAARLDHDRLVTAVQKTVEKISDAAVALVAQTRISPRRGRRSTTPCSQ